MGKGFFIAGTDTGVGKTWATVALMHYFKAQGKRVVGMKPVAAGCEWLDGRLRNNDALLLQQNASIKVGYEEINPYAFQMPVSPHLAGNGNPVELDKIVQGFDSLKNKADIVVVEGAGGWLAPLNQESDIADLAKALQIPVIMVIAIQLGCINHARLTFQAVQASKVECAGWLAMCVDPAMQKQTENVETIKNKISAPLLGVLPFIEEMDFDLLAKNMIKGILI